MESQYLTSAAKAHQLPRYKAPEVAFVGRSNCGKSTLLNALMNRKIARTSRTPGCTKMVNFFSYGDEMIFADLPGYGFAKSAKSSRRYWDQLMQSYMGRPNLLAFLFLIDSRRVFLEEDLDLLLHLAERAPVQLVLTKVDKLSKGLWRKKLSDTESFLSSQKIPIAQYHLISSAKKINLQNLQQLLRNSAKSTDVQNN